MPKKPSRSLPFATITDELSATRRSLACLNAAGQLAETGNRRGIVPFVCQPEKESLSLIRHGEQAGTSSESGLKQRPGYTRLKVRGICIDGKGGEVSSRLLRRTVPFRRAAIAAPRPPVVDRRCFVPTEARFCAKTLTSSCLPDPVARDATRLPLGDTFRVALHARSSDDGIRLAIAVHREDVAINALAVFACFEQDKAR